MNKSEKEEPRPPNHKWPWLEEHIATITLLALTAASIYVCYLIARPFFSALAWATALAIAALPLHKRVAKRIHNSSLAAGVSVLLVILLLLLPMALLVPQLINQVVDGVNAIQEQIRTDGLTTAIERHAWIKPAWLWIEQRIDLKDALQRLASVVTTGASYVVKGSFVGLIELVVMFFFLFFFFRDRHAAIAGLRQFLPLDKIEADEVFTAVTDTIYATIYGKLLVGIAQGFLGGLMFWWLGLTAPWFWAIIMGILSIIPLVGPPVVWLPAALLLLLDGHWIKAIVLTAWGALVVGSIDNFLYPIFVRQRLRLHTVAIFIAMVGGLVVFGPAGFFVGPVALAVTLALLRIWRDREGARVRKVER